MQILTLQATSEMNALVSIASVRESGNKIRVEFGTSVIGKNKVSFKRSHRDGNLEIDYVEIDYRANYLFYGDKLSKFSQTELMLIGAAMMKINVQTIKGNGDLLTLEAPVREVIIERTVVVERQRPTYQQPTRQVVRETHIPMNTRTPEEDLAVAVGTGIGLAIGLLGTALRNRR